MSNVDVMRGLYDAFSQGDIPTVLGGMDPNIEWREAEGIATSQVAIPGGVQMRS